MMLSTFAKNRLFIKSFLSILMLLMLFCTPDALKANASFDTSVTTSFVPSEYLPLETEQATAVVRANKAFLPERGLNRETGFPLLTLLFLLLYPLCTRSLRTLSWADLLLPRLAEIRGMLPLPGAPPLHRILRFHSQGLRVTHIPPCVRDAPKGRARPTAAMPRLGATLRHSLTNDKEFLWTSD